MFLVADTKRAWLDTHFAAWFAYFDPAVEHRVLSVADLVDGGLAALHGQLTAAGTPAKAAAKYLAAWYGGLVARSVGYAAVAADASLLVEPDGLRWHAHPDAWAAKVELGEPGALVPGGHPWADEAAVVADECARHERAVVALTEAVRPLVESLRELGGLGLPGLWAEVGDGFGGVLAYQSALPVTPQRIGTLRGLSGAERAPWKARLELWQVGTSCVMRKGGCCRAYTEPSAPGYCSDCPLRDLASCEAEQLAQR